MTTVPNYTNFARDKQGSLHIERLPGISFNCLKWNLPGASASHVEMGTPRGIIKMPGTTINYEPLRVTFAIDENYRGYVELLRWLKGISTNGNNIREEYLQSLPKNDSGDTSVATLLIRDASGKVILSSRYIHIFPVNVPDVDFDVTGTEAETQIVNVEFQFYDMELEYDNNSQII